MRSPNACTLQAPLALPLLATLLITAGELFLAPIGLALVSRCGPAHARSTAIGLWFLAGGLAGLVAGPVGTLYSAWSPPSFFLLLALVCLLDTALMRWAAPRLQRAALAHGSSSGEAKREADDAHL